MYSLKDIYLMYPPNVFFKRNFFLYLKNMKKMSFNPELKRVQL